VGGLPGTAEGGLTLRVTADGEAGEVFWFVNGSFYKSAPANRDVLLPWPAAGPLTVSCTDARGLSDEIAVAVE
jgi:membrane carboxypeptidase/penicillin-binding protein PbpC